MEKEVLVQIIAAFSGAHQNLVDLDPKDPLAQIGRTCEKLFTLGVATLSKFGNPVIQDLMSYVWDVYHYRHVAMAIGPNVPSLSMTVAQSRKTGDIQALTFAPHNWPEMVAQDPVMQLGAIIAMGSQATDFYNNKILSKEDSLVVKERALSYEAEYLKMIEGHPFNEYQQEVLAKYPNGFDASFSYQRKPIATPETSS